jgi:hypothetical protein
MRVVRALSNSPVRATTVLGLEHFLWVAQCGAEFFGRGDKLHDGGVDARIGFRRAFFEQNSPDQSSLSFAFATSLDCRCMLSGASVRVFSSDGRRFVFVRGLVILEGLLSASTKIRRFPDVRF